MESTAQVRLNPADLINAAIDALVQARYELPTLSLFRRMAGSVSERTLQNSMTRVHSRLSVQQCDEVDSLLIVKSPTEWSPFGRLCQHSGSITRANVGLMIERLNSVPVNVNAKELLAGTAALRVEQWADEARRLSAAELREYSVVRRRVLLLCVVQTLQGKATG